MKRSFGAVAVAVTLLAATGARAEGGLIDKIDVARQWAGEKFVDVVDATDKAFGESRIEDKQQIVRAKVGLKYEWREGQEEEDWSIPSNFRIPLPALTRKANIYLDFSASTDTSNLSDISAATDEKDASLSATVLTKLSETFDLGATLGVHGGPDIGPEVFVRYEQDWLPWKLFAEQRGYWRTDNGWGGRTLANLDYRLAGGNSFVRWGNKADYYEELHDVDLKTGLSYRWLSPRNVALSAETGIEYNPYDGDPEAAEPTTANDDDDQGYARLRMIGKVYRNWIEWEVMPGYYYMWEHDDTGVWGIDLRLSIMYEAFLRDE